MNMDVCRLSYANEVQGAFTSGGAGPDGLRKYAEIERQAFFYRFPCGSMQKIDWVLHAHYIAVMVFGVLFMCTTWSDSTITDHILFDPSAIKMILGHCLALAWTFTPICNVFNSMYHMGSRCYSFGIGHNMLRSKIA